MERETTASPSRSSRIVASGSRGPARSRPGTGRSRPASEARQARRRAGRGTPSPGGFASRIGRGGRRCEGQPGRPRGRAGAGGPRRRRGEARGDRGECEGEDRGRGGSAGRRDTGRSPSIIGRSEAIRPLRGRRGRAVEIDGRGRGQETEGMLRAEPESGRTLALTRPPTDWMTRDEAPTPTSGAGAAGDGRDADASTARRPAPRGPRRRAPAQGSPRWRRPARRPGSPPGGQAIGELVLFPQRHGPGARPGAGRRRRRGREPRPPGDGDRPNEGEDLLRRRIVLIDLEDPARRTRKAVGGSQASRARRSRPIARRTMPRRPGRPRRARSRRLGGPGAGRPASSRSFQRRSVSRQFMVGGSSWRQGRGIVRVALERCVRRVGPAHHLPSSTVGGAHPTVPPQFALCIPPSPHPGDPPPHQVVGQAAGPGLDGPHGPADRLGDLLRTAEPVRGTGQRRGG